MRAKNGTPSTHPLRGPEIRAVRLLRRLYGESPYVFVTERKGPLTAFGVWKILARAGEEVELKLPVHPPHMLRHRHGIKLGNDGQNTRAIQHYLPDRQIQHTVRYTELASGRFDRFWRD